jgi:hypothetical protein
VNEREVFLRSAQDSPAYSVQFDNGQKSIFARVCDIFGACSDIVCPNVTASVPNIGIASSFVRQARAARGNVDTVIQHATRDNHELLVLFLEEFLNSTVSSYVAAQDTDTAGLLARMVGSLLGTFDNPTSLDPCSDEFAGIRQALVAVINQTASNTLLLSGEEITTWYCCSE